MVPDVVSDHADRRQAHVWGGTGMLAEVFMLGLEAAAPVAKEAANSSRLIRIL
jgi:hypothetical protein